MKKYKILLSCYAVSPYRGSEYSVAWNYILSMSKEHELYVIYGTSGNHMGDNVEIEKYIKQNHLTNVNFIFVGQVLVIPGTGPTQPAPGPTPAPPAPPVGSFELGGQTQTFANSEQMSDSNMTWVKFQYKWGPGDTTDTVAVQIQKVKSLGWKVLISVTGKTPYPAANSIDFAAFTQFLGSVAALNPDAIDNVNRRNAVFTQPE